MENITWTSASNLVNMYVFFTKLIANILKTGTIFIIL